MSTDTTMRGLRPSAAVRGDFRAPGSKSIAQRALVIAGLCAEPVRIAGLPEGEDVRAACELLRGVGVEVERLAPAAVRVRGIPPGPHRGWLAREPIAVGESGTLARFALAAAGLCGRAEQRVEVVARGTLAGRASRPLLRALREAGVAVERETWPIVLRPIGPPSELRLVDPISSQEVSALCIALAAWPDEIRLEVDGAIPSRPYAAMTLRLLGRFGVRIDARERNNGASFAIRGPLRAPSEPIVIEPDASLAAVALAAACLSGGEVKCGGLTLDALQGDVRMVEHLREFGCRSLALADGLVASGFPQHGARIDCSDTPDLAPVLAIVAAGAALVADDAQAGSELTGLETLPGKESSRIEVLARGLRDAGWSVVASSNSLRIGRRANTSNSPVVLDPSGDHRMAFAFALLGLLRPGVDVAHPECVGKSWPSFWDDLARLGAKVEQT
jgi:3-phosphoshikimate 1-carboxyvinyltransferase